MNASLRLEFTLTPKELSEGKEFALRRRVARGSKWGMNLILVLFVAAAAWIVWQQVDASERKLWLPLLAVIWVVTFVTLRRVRGRPQSPTLIECSTQMFQIVASNTCTRLLPCQLAVYAESDQVLVLRDRDGHQTIYIPKRAFADEQSIAWLKALLGTSAELPAVQPG